MSTSPVSKKYTTAAVHPVPEASCSTASVSSLLTSNTAVSSDNTLNVAGHNPHLDHDENAAEIIPVDVMLNRLAMAANKDNVQDETPDRQVSAIVIGAGNRGGSYCNFALDHPHRLKIVGVVDPVAERRALIVEKHGVPAENVFTEWEQLSSLPKLADIAIIATPDRDHHKPSLELAAKGYHILLEKPMAVTESECRDIVGAMNRSNVLFAVCHVLRYTPANRLLAALISSGAIGELININHTEPVGYYHFAHSYVRGQWSNEAKSTFSLMAKSCHDIDLIRYWMGGSDNPAVRVSSFGSLKHFNKKNKPQNSSSSCLTCSQEPNCPYSAKKIYLDPLVKSNFKGWPTSALTAGVPDIESVISSLKTGDFGKCVYDSKNDVVDHQVVNLEFAQGQTASFTMVAFSEKLCKRQTKVYGSHGELTCIDGTEIRHFDFTTQKTKIYRGCDLSQVGRLIGHDGADYYLMDSFVKAVAKNDRNYIKTGGTDALDSHLLVFAAEKARKERKVVEIEAAKLEMDAAAERADVERKHIKIEVESEEKIDDSREFLQPKITISPKEKTRKIVQATTAF